MSLYRLIKFETKKLFKDRIAHTGAIVIFIVAVLYFLSNYAARPPGSYTGPSIIVDTIYFQGMGIFTIPLLTILIAVHLNSNELYTGTLKEVLTKPVKRENIIVSKFITIFLYIGCICYGLLALSSVMGIYWGYPGNIGSLIPKVLFIYFVYILGSMVLAAFTLMISTFGARPVLTALVALGFHAASVILIVQPSEQIKAYAFSQLMFDLVKLAMNQISSFRDIYQPLAIIVIYILGFLLVGSFIWEKRDITVH